MTNPDDVVDRLCAAVNRHDLDELAACFAADYRNATPAHPERGFVGREQVRHNWQQLFQGMPDLASRVLARAEADASVWTEWEMRGTRGDGQPHLMRGVIIFGVSESVIRSARFYLEPVVVGPGGVDDAIEHLVATEPRR